MSEQTVVDAVNDLTRVTVALHGGFSSKSEAIRMLHELSIPPVRIAAVLAVKYTDVTSVLTKQKKREKRERINDGQRKSRRPQ